MISVCGVYLLTWQVYLASWRNDWKAQHEAIKRLETHFQKGIPMVSNLMWNVIMFTIVLGMLLRGAGFSARLQQFCSYTVLLPQLLGSVAYYCYKFGFKEVQASLSITTFLPWIQNWFTMQGLTFVALTHTALLYFFGMFLQPYIVPATWDFSVQFPKDVYEEYLPVWIYWFVGLFLVCAMTLPLWKRGYEVSMEAAGRPNVKLSYTETFMELLYQSCQGCSSIWMIPILVMLQDYCGFRVHFLHMVFAAIEVALANYVVSLKFCITHQMMHEIQPLYAMTHVEHHVCKGVHPTTPAVGLWENWVNGGTIFFTIQFGVAPIPYALLQTIYMGANVVVHTMWPSPKLLQWHTMHHTICADVYNVNIPGPYDKEHSKCVAKLQSKLQQVSPFVRYEPLSDVAAACFIIAASVILHYGFGLGIGYVNFDLDYHQDI